MLKCKKNQREHVHMHVNVLGHVTVYMKSSSLHQDLGICCSRRGQPTLCLLFPGEHFSTAEIPVPKPEWWHNCTQESFHCFSARVGEHISLYIFRCTNILAYSTMHKYLPINQQNWQKDMEKLYNKKEWSSMFLKPNLGSQRRQLARFCDPGWSLLCSDRAHTPVRAQNCKISPELYVISPDKVPIKGKSYTSVFSHGICTPISHQHKKPALLFHNIFLSVLRGISISYWS